MFEVVKYNQTFSRLTRTTMTVLGCPGLPDGLKPKFQIGYILGLGMDNFDM
jgi:hypothetical protein